MTISPLAVSGGNSPKRSSREGTRIDTFLVHHMAGTDGPGTTRMMLGSGGRTVSANYTIWDDGTIHQVVPEEFRAWTSGSPYDGGKGAQWDRRSITVEIENHTAGPNWEISAAALNAAAALFNDLKKRYGVNQILGHRDLYARFGASYATYCPGPNTVAEIVRRAGGNPQAGSSAGGGVSTGPSYHKGDITVAGVSGKQVQERLVAHGFSVGSHGLDGKIGDDSINAIIGFQNKNGLVPDGIVGPATWTKLQQAPGTKTTPTAPAFPLPAGSYFGPKSGPAQSVSGYYSHREDLKRFQLQMHNRGWQIGVDGLYGPNTAENVRQFQKEKGLTVDGLIGPQTWAAAWTSPVT